MESEGNVVGSLWGWRRHEFSSRPLPLTPWQSYITSGLVEAWRAGPISSPYRLWAWLNSVQTSPSDRPSLGWRMGVVVVKEPPSWRVKKYHNRKLMKEADEIHLTGIEHMTHGIDFSCENENYHKISHNIVVVTQRNRWYALLVFLTFGTGQQWLRKQNIQDM